MSCIDANPTESDEEALDVADDADDAEEDDDDLSALQDVRAARV
jgi:hypothetical protein